MLGAFARGASPGLPGGGVAGIEPSGAVDTPMRCGVPSGGADALRAEPPNGDEEPDGGALPEPPNGDEEPDGGALPE
ncbi:MAG TPA: hypothetical protein VIU61_21265, partial [Kofleriaceae bacterium]